MECEKKAQTLGLPLLLPLPSLFSFQPPRQVSPEGLLTSVCKHVPLEGAGPREDPGTVGTVDLLQAVGIGVPLCSQQPVFGRATLLLIGGAMVVGRGSSHLFLSVILCSLQKGTELVGICGGQHFLDASKLPTGVQVHSTAVGEGPVSRSPLPTPLPR